MLAFTSGEAHDAKTGALLLDILTITGRSIGVQKENLEGFRSVLTEQNADLHARTSLTNAS